jgi:hypothetical protein
MEAFRTFALLRLVLGFFSRTMRKANKKDLTRRNQMRVHQADVKFIEITSLWNSSIQEENKNKMRGRYQESE